MQTTAAAGLLARRWNMGAVVAASAAGTAFEWYDFFVFLPLATILSKIFFAGLNDAAAYVFALGSFAAGFAFRPLGALIFGRIGDRAGRKGAFLITILMMGFATFAIGLLPTYGQIGILSPAIFIALRLVQGLALGGEWGGAAIYIAEHAPPGRRGYLTSWIGASAAFGLGGALIVTLISRLLVGEVAFAAWGWRIPFLASVALLGVSVWFRLKMAESPAFQRIRAEGRRSEAPYAESFLRWPHARLVLTALFGVMVAQGAVWYCSFFYAQSFIEKTLKARPETVNAVMIALVALSAPLYVLFGWLSDRIGRKPVMAAGMALFVIGVFPVFHLITRAASPALAEASARAPITVAAEPRECSLQFDPVGKAQFRTSCDILKSALTDSGVSYRNVPAASGTTASATVGGRVVASVDGRGMSPPGLKTAKAAVATRLKAALTAAGYPTGGDRSRTDGFGILAALMVLAVASTALYGPQAACLVELFPTRIRYTALSLPYHVGTGWVGGFLPTTVYAMAVGSGDVYFGLWYPLLATALSLAVLLLFLPETRTRDLDA